MTDTQDLVDALQSYDLATSGDRASAACLLAQTVRDYINANKYSTSDVSRHRKLRKVVDDDDVSHSSHRENGTTILDLSILSHKPFSFDGILYHTIQNAFQAQKALPSEREAFGTVSPMEAINRGRMCKIDPIAWDLNREDLMTSIVEAQALQHDKMRDVLIKWKDTPIVVDDMFDSFWPLTLPHVFAKLGRKFCEARVADSGQDAASTQLDASML